MTDGAIAARIGAKGNSPPSVRRFDAAVEARLRAVLRGILTLSIYLRRELPPVDFIRLVPRPASRQEPPEDLGANTCPTSRAPV